MGVADLEGRLRGLRLVETGIAVRAIESLRLKRHLRVAWSAAAAAALMAVGVGMTGRPETPRMPTPQIVEIEGIRCEIPVEARPSPRAVMLAFSERKSLETRLLQGDLR